jgi:hypothetical protein
MAAVGALVIAQPALADDLAAATSSIDIACSGIEVATEISRTRLAEVTLVVAGLRPSQLLTLTAQRLGHSPSEDELSAEALLLVQDTSLLPTPLADQVDAIIAMYQDNLTKPEGLLVSKLVVRGVALDQSPFDAGMVLICPGKTKLNTIAGAQNATDKPGANEAFGSRLVLRAKLEDATVDGKDASGSFQGSFARIRSTDLKGETTWTRTVTAQGIAGVRVLGKPNVSHLFAYGDYALSNVRKRSAPTETPKEKDGSKDDIHALELGAYGSVPIGIGKYILRASGRVGAVLDFEHKSRRLVGGLRFQPILSDQEIGIKGFTLCGVNYYTDRFLLPFETRCTGALRVEASEVLKAGTADLTDKDQLLALGGEIGFEFRPPLRGNDPADGLVGGVAYRYQQMVAGHAPSIDRLDITLKYRWWIDKLALDFGLTFADGIETKTFTDENKIGLAFGVLF